MILEMVTHSDAQSTVGKLQAGSAHFYTIEQPWNNNEQDKSCIPKGSYELIPYTSPVHGETYCLHNPLLNVYAPPIVQTLPQGARTYCEIHSANFARELKGCIALGVSADVWLDPTTNDMTPVVTQSRLALQEFLKVISTRVYGHVLNIERTSV